MNIRNKTIYLKLTDKEVIALIAAMNFTKGRSRAWLPSDDKLKQKLQDAVDH